MKEREPVPSRLATKIQDLRGDGDADSVEMHGIRWNPRSWQRRNHPVLRDVLPGVIDASEPHPDMPGWLVIRRHAVLSFGTQDTNPHRLFVAAMVWGFGNRGYGAARTERILRQDGFATNVRALIDASRRGPAQAWDAITETYRTRYLGPAFATKVAYFAAFSSPSNGPTRPLIADLNTSRAMWHLCEIPQSAQRRDSYLRYVEVAHRWAADNGWRPDEVERALFEIGKSGKGPDERHTSTAEGP